MADQHADRPDSSPAAKDVPKKRRTGRIVLLSLLGLMVLLLVLVAFTPAILSTGWGSARVQNIADDAIPGSIVIDDLSLSWFGSQQLRGVVLNDPEGKPVAEVGRLSTELSLWDAIWGDLDLGETKIIELDADIVVDEEGVTNIDRALGLEKKPEEPEQPTQIPPSLKLHATLTDANVKITAPATGADPVYIHDVNGEVTLTGPTQPIALTLTGKTQQGNLTGGIELSANADKAFNSAGVMTPETLVADVKANVTRLPVAGIDALAGMEGLLVAAVGDLMNVQVVANATAAEQTFTANIAAPNVKAELAGRIADEQFALTQPGVVNFTLTPALVAHAGAKNLPPGEAPMQLAAPVPLTLTIAQLSAAVPDPAAGPMVIHAALNAGRDIQLRNVQQVGEVTIANLSGKVDAEQVRERITFALNAGLTAGGQPGKLAINGAAENVMTDKPLALNAEAALEGVPTALVDRIAQQEGKLVALLGEQVNLRASANTTVAEAAADPAGDISLAMTTPRLNTGDIALAIANNRVQLRQPAQIRYELTPQAAAQLLGPEPAAKIDQPATLTLNVEALSAPWPRGDEPMFQPDNTQVKAGLTSTPLHLSGVAQVGQVVVENLFATVGGESLSDIRTTLVGILRDPAEAGLLREATGSPLQIDLAAATGLVTTTQQEGMQLKPITARVQMASDRLSAKVQATADSEFKAVQLTQPAELKLTVTPGLLRRLEVTAPDQPSLAEPATITATVPKLTAPLANFAPGRVQAQIAAQFDRLVLAGDDPRLAGAAVRDGKLTLNVDGPAGVVVADLNAQAAVPGQNQPGPIALNARMTDMFKDGTQPAIEAKAQIEGLPTAFVDMVAEQGGTLPPLIGPVVNVNAVANLRGGETMNGTVEAKLASANLKADANLAMRDNLLTAREPVQVQLMLTPAGYAALTKPAPPEAGQPPAEPPTLVLAENSPLNITVPKLTWHQPPEGTPFDPSKASIEATITSPALAMRDTSPGGGQTITLRDLNVALNAPNLAQPLNVTMRSQVVTSGAAASREPPPDVPGVPGVPEGVIGRPAQPLQRNAAPLPPRDEAQRAPGTGSLEATARISDLYTRDGQLNTDNMTVAANAKLADFPTIVADQMLGQEGMLVAAMGPSMGLTAQADLKQMKGPVAMKIVAANATADIDALYQGDVLTLRQPLTANLRVTDQLGTRFLSKLNFIFESLESGEEPIQVRIDPKGFVLPLKDFDVARVQVPSLTIAPGELVLNNRGYIGGLLNLWAKFGGGLGDRPTDRVNAIFTPLVARIENGRFVYDARMDLRIAGALHVATWGTVDLNNNVKDLTLAIMPETLDKVFDIEDVQPDEALRIKMTGNPSKDLAGSTLSILTTLARGGAFGGDERIGRIIGAVGGALTGRKELKGSMPPPSMQPLPWAPLEVTPGRTAAPPPPPDGRQPPRMQPDGRPVAPPPPAPGNEAPPPPRDGDRPREERRPSDREALERAAGELLEGLLKPKSDAPKK